MVLIQVIQGQQVYVDNAMMLMRNLTFISQPHIEGVASDVKDSTL